MSRWDSAAIVPNTSELLPEPETPVNAVSRRFGISRLTSWRLFTRAPRTRIRSWLSATCVAGGCRSVLAAMLILSPSVRQCSAVFGSVRQCSAVFGSVRQCSAASGRRGFPREPIRIDERPDVAGDHDAVRARAVRRDARVLGGGASPVERQLDGRGLAVELDVLAAETLRHRQASVYVELLGRLDVLDTEQQRDFIDLAGGRTGVLLGRGRDFPDRSIRGLDHPAVAPESLLGGLQRCGAGVQCGADEAVDGARLGNHERQREPTEPGGRRLGSPDTQLPVQVKGGGVERGSGIGVRHLQDDGVDGGHQRTSWIRTRLPAGSRTAQSRTPYGWSVGSWTISASLDCSCSKVPSRSLVASRMLP